jgi:hypothetical protein
MSSWTVFSRRSDPVTQRLPVHPAGLGSALPVDPLKDQRDRQHPPRRPRILRPSRRQPHLRRRQILPRDLDSHPDLPVLDDRESQFRQLGSPPRVTGKGRPYEKVMRGQLDDACARREWL